MQQRNPFVKVRIESNDGHAELAATVGEFEDLTLLDVVELFERALVAHGYEATAVKETLREVADAV